MRHLSRFPMACALALTIIFAAPATKSANAAEPGDAIAGEKVFARCVACHSLTPDKHGIGPSLAGMMNRKAGSAAGYSYSAAMRDSEIVWTAETLNTLLIGGPEFMPGNRMATFFAAGVQDPVERSDVIAYLIEATTQ